MDQIYEARAEVIKALAHPARLRMADALSEGEMCVCELQEIVGSSMPTVSRHLSQMKNAGLIEGRRDGNQVYYRLLVPCVLRMFGCIDAVLQSEHLRAREAVEA